MQNPYVKYLKTKNGYFYLFYYEHGNIFCRSFSHDGWTVPQKIAEKASPVFSVCQYEAITYLLYSGGEGQLYLASSADFASWEHLPHRPHKVFPSAKQGGLPYYLPPANRSNRRGFPCLQRLSQWAMGKALSD